MIVQDGQCKYVWLGTLGETAIWQLGLFPLTIFGIKKIMPGKFSRYRFPCLLLAELISFGLLLVVTVSLTLIFGRAKIMYDPELCDSPSDCKSGLLINSTTYQILVDSANVTIYHMKGREKGVFKKEQMAVVYFHGNSGNVASHLPSVSYRNLLNMGLDVFTWDPPGYGHSYGSPSYNSWFKTSEKALIKIRDIGTDSLILYGRSLGGAVAAILASQYVFPALIMEVPLDSMSNLFKDLFRISGFVMGPVWRDPFDAFDVMDKIETCIFHYGAEKDDLILQYRQKAMNFKATHKKANCSLFFIGASMGHNDVAWTSHYTWSVKEFIRNINKNY